MGKSDCVFFFFLRGAIEAWTCMYSILHACDFMCLYVNTICVYATLMWICSCVFLSFLFIPVLSDTCTSSKPSHRCIYIRYWHRKTLTDVLPTVPAGLDALPCLISPVCSCLYRTAYFVTICAVSMCDCFGSGVLVIQHSTWWQARPGNQTTQANA